MKKNKVPTFLLIVLVTVLSSQIAYASTDNGTNDKEDFFSIAQPDGNVTKDSVDRANELLNQLPDTLLEGFVNGGWKFYITDKNIAKTYFPGIYNSVKGFLWTNQQSIYVEQRSEAVETAVIHEFGHYIDFIKGYPSRSEEFQEIFNSESEIFVETFHVNFYYDIGEFFADGIYRYFTEYETEVEKYCPQLVTFIEETLEKDNIAVLCDGD